MQLPVNNTERQIDAALFDLDGTLVETHIDFAALKSAMVDFASDRGIPAQDAARLDALAIVDCVARHAAGARESVRREAFSIIEEIETQGCSQPQASPGAAQWAAALRGAGVRVGVVTRNCRRLSLQLLAKFDIAYDVLLSRDDVELTKPHPSHLLAALDLVGVAPERAVMVGDHWMDVRAGRASRCAATIGVIGDRGPEWFDPEPPDFIVSSIAQAHSLFGPV